MSFSCLVVDAGHTRTKFARCELVSDVELPQVADNLAVLEDDPVDWGTIAAWFQDAAPEAVVVTGTNLSKARQVVDAWPSTLPVPSLLTDRSRLPIRADVDAPEKVGMDRLLNAIAANTIRRKGGPPVICVDTGTAITVDVVGSDGTFRGGAILPGILLAARSLKEQTTTLPLIDVWKLLASKPEVLGRSTEAAIASGLYWGHLGAVKELVVRLTEQLYATDGAPLLLLTGGASVILEPYLPTAHRFPQLSLQGLALAAKQLEDFGYRGQGLGGGV